MICLSFKLTKVFDKKSLSMASYKEELNDHITCMCIKSFLRTQIGFHPCYMFEYNIKTFRYHVFNLYLLAKEVDIGYEQQT